MPQSNVTTATCLLYTYSKRLRLASVLLGNMATLNYCRKDNISLGKEKHTYSTFTFTKPKLLNKHSKHEYVLQC